jgi:hypothetical protein
LIVNWGRQPGNIEMPRPRNTLFLSHSSKDKELATRFAQLLRSISLSQLEIWFSSDGSYAGGLRPGDRWFDEIKEKMAQSSAIVALITENSADSPWVLFESGIGAATQEKKLIVVTHGINTPSKIPSPLLHWQTFRIDKIDDLKEFCGKILETFDIALDEVLFSAYSRRFLQQTGEPKTPIVHEDPQQAEHALHLKPIIEHFDRRFFELTSKMDTRSNYLAYEISLSNAFDEARYEIEITESMTVQNVLDEIYGLISEHVGVWTYLEKWVLVHDRTDLRLIIREVGDAISATSVFKPQSHWIIAKLERPYTPKDSDPDRFYGKALN